MRMVWKENQPSTNRIGPATLAGLDPRCRLRSSHLRYPTTRSYWRDDLDGFENA